MSSTNVKKKVTKIIRKDEILYRPAGGSTCLPEEPDMLKTQESPDNKSKGKVIKRADGTTIVVVDGKIVKSIKADSTNIAAPSTIHISADELSSDTDSPVYANKQHLNIKRTIIVDKPQAQHSPTGLKRPPLISEKERIQKHEGYDVKKRARSWTDRNPKSVQQASQRSHKARHSGHSLDRSKVQQDVPHREVSPSQTQKHKKYQRSNDWYQRADSKREHSHARVKSKRTEGRSRPPSKIHRDIKNREQPYHEPARTSQSQKASERKSPLEDGKAYQPDEHDTNNVCHDSLNSLLNQEHQNCSKEDIVNLIQKQAEKMLQNQQRGPIDEQKREKLRVAMEAILVQRGIIKKHDQKSRSLLRASSSESSGNEESPILERLHQKYTRESDEMQTSVPVETEEISPDIDDISVASEPAHNISDVSASDMEVSDDGEPIKDNEDGETPAFRKSVEQSQDIEHNSSSSQVIKIKLGSASSEGEDFQKLSAQIEQIKSSNDVPSLIEAIELKIKSLLNAGLPSSTLEKQVKKYQSLVAKVVIKAESVKEQEEDEKITYHKFGNEKGSLGAGDLNNNVCSYPVHSQDSHNQQKPWVKPQVPVKENSLSSPLEPHESEIQPQPNNPYEEVAAEFVSQREGYHVCLLCMIESTTAPQFQKHLDGKKHRDAVEAKVKQKTQGNINLKKLKKHALVIRCKLCDVTCNSEKKYNDHVGHRTHQAFIQAYLKIGRVVPEPEILRDVDNVNKKVMEEIQGSETPAVGREFMSVKTVRDCDDNVVDVYYCALCKLNCKSEIQVEKHVRSNKHYLIYVKATQPDVNIQVHAAEHKRRRETTKKIITTMKTIKQMEVIVERNRGKRTQDSHGSADIHDGNPYNEGDAVASWSRNESESAIQGFKLGQERALGKVISESYEVHTTHQGSPYYRDPSLGTSAESAQSFYPQTILPVQVDGSKNEVHQPDKASKAPQVVIRPPHVQFSTMHKTSGPSRQPAIMLQPHQEAKSTFKAVQDFGKSNMEQHFEGDVNYQSSANGYGNFRYGPQESHGLATTGRTSLEQKILSAYDGYNNQGSNDHPSSSTESAIPFLSNTSESRDDSFSAGSTSYKTGNTDHSSLQNAGGSQSYYSHNPGYPDSPYQSVNTRAGSNLAESPVDRSNYSASVYNSQITTTPGSQFGGFNESIPSDGVGSSYSTYGNNDGHNNSNRNESINDGFQSGNQGLSASRNQGFNNSNLGDGNKAYHSSSKHHSYSDVNSGSQQQNHYTRPPLPGGRSQYPTSVTQQGNTASNEPQYANSGPAAYSGKATYTGVYTNMKR